MKKIILSCAVAGTLFSTAYADDVSDLKAQVEQLTKKINKLEKKQKRDSKKIAQVKAHDAYDNIKFDVDFRTSYDYLNFKMADGSEQKNNGLYSMRLWLNMGYAPTDNMMFKGQLAVNKAFGQRSFDPHNPQGNGFDSFDWIVTENLTDGNVRLREAYWFWSPHAMGRDWTVSVGRRPATNGFLVNLREDDKAKSPIGHIINMEFDGASVSMKTGDILEGSYIKLCVGRGLSNASARFNGASSDYVTSDNMLHNMDLVGAIAKLYDDGQYVAFAKYYRAFDVIGMDMRTDPTMPSLATYGDMDGADIALQINGIGDEISDFLDETIIFASYAWSQTVPKDNQPMLGSMKKESGDSIYVGLQTPNLTGGKFGLEYNHGSKYWRPFTYAEDTMAGSKVAVRGDAYEVYWTQPIIKKDDKSVFDMQIRYTYMDYDYTGSQAFFGDAGTPIKVEDANKMGMGSQVADTAQDLRVYFRYRY